MVNGILKDESGNIALSFAIIAPLLLIAAGIGIDFQQGLAQRIRLQDAADTLALRGARELLLDNASAESIESMIEASADAQYRARFGAFVIDAEVDTKENTARVIMSQPPRKGFFLGAATNGDAPIEVDATAQAKGAANICVIALDEEADRAISLDGASKLDASKCAVISNSKSKASIRSGGLSSIKASFICAGGGAAGSALSFQPSPLLDCPVYADPLTDRVAPTAGACDFNDLEVGDRPNLGGRLLSLLEAVVATIDGSFAGTLSGYQRRDLSPGVYCGGLAVNDKSDLHLRAGVYVMKDGPLVVSTGARIFGENVGFYLDGDRSTFNFEAASIIHLTAPMEGLMAGLLFWEECDAPEGRTHAILSANARQLLGTIYLPKGRLEVGSTMPIADKSAYTAIVARRFSMSGAPTMVLNSNYSATSIPVPEGLGPTGGQVFLRE